MRKRGKKFAAARAAIAQDRTYSIEEAVPLVQKAKYAKFDETVDLSLRLGVDPKHADQMVRGTVVLPHGLGKTKRVLAIASGEKQQEAQEAGADIVGGEEMVEKIQGGFMDFCKNFNARTAKDEGLIIPVVVTVYADRSYSFITKTPPAAVLLKRAANIAKGSAEPNKTKVGTVTAKQVEDIARTKMPDLNCDTLESAIKTVAGTARSMGLDVIG